MFGSIITFLSILYYLKTNSAEVIEAIMSEPRTATVERNTNETQIKVSVNLDGTGLFKIKSGLPFLEHMLEQVSRHGLVDIDIVAKGDLEIDAHHTVEDLGITLGQTIDKAL